MHEPLAVQAAGGLFEQRDAALVGGDQVVVGRENVGDALLIASCGQLELKRQSFVRWR